MLKKKQVAILGCIYMYIKIKKKKSFFLNNKEIYTKVTKRDKSWYIYGRQNAMQMKSLYQMRLIQRNLK